MYNIEVVETNLMYSRIKDITDPKTALEKLKTSTCSMGFGCDDKQMRYLAYGLWLKEHGPEGWFDYLIESNRILLLLALGHCPDKIPDAPANWIAPMDYIAGEKKINNGI